MACRNLHSLTRLLLVCLLTLAAGGAAFAEPDYRALKQDIKKLEDGLNDAAREARDADKKVADNNSEILKAQQAGDAALEKKLKTTGTTLARQAGDAAKKLREAERGLANKHGELRAAAAKHAVAQLTAAGNLDARVKEARDALSDWRDAIGALPGVPDTDKLKGISDPETKAAAAKQLKSQLDDFDKWVSDEEKRIGTEIKQAAELINAESKLKDAKDGPALVKSAKALKAELDERKIQLGELHDAVKDAHKTLK
jgi:hypothetical protein